MSSAQFDPCWEWLGINAVELADPRRVLGLLPSESDPLAVLRAAEARLSLLKGVTPGPFDMARNALIKRVEEAREAVLCQIAAMPRPTAPVGTTFVMPPPPGGGAAAAPPPAPAMPMQAAPVFQPPPPPAVPMPPTSGIPVVPTVPPVPMVPAPTQASPWSDQPGGDSGGFVAVKTRPVYRKESSGHGILLVAMAALLVAAGGLAWLKLRPREPAAKRETAAVIDKQPPERDAPEKAAAPRRVIPRRERDPNDTTSDEAVSTSPPPQRESMKVERKRKPEPEPEPEPEPKPEPEPETKPQPKPKASTPDPDDEPDDEPKPNKPPAADDASAEEIAPLLAEVLAALQEKEFDAAALAVKAADKKTDGGPAQRRVASWDSLITYAKGFDDYRRQAIAAVQPGQEYEVDGKQVAVVENDDEKFIYRYAGRSKTVPSDKIPGAILMTIVTEWFDEKPANHLYLGAYHATKPEPDLDKARSQWEMAEAGGADASALLPLLEDPVLVKAAADAGDQ